MAISGSEVSWAEPAYSSRVMASAMDSVRPDLTMATPVTKPQVAVAISAGTMAWTPERNAFRRCWRTAPGSSDSGNADSEDNG
ncbi:hypothetical protein D3C87_1861520 [compost metagenome]